LALEGIFWEVGEEGVEIMRQGGGVLDVNDLDEWEFRGVP
jgi:hypothetical protein